MNRSRIIALAVLLVILSIILSIGAMLYFSWTLALSGEQKRLAAYAQRMLIRADITLKESKSVLRIIAASSLAPCSDAHLKRLRQLTNNTSSISEIGYFAGGLLKCTSWGLTNKKIVETPPDYETPDGFQFTLIMKPLVSDSEQMLAIHYKDYNVLINPERFVDIIGESDMQLALATADGHVIGVSAGADRALIKEILAHPKSEIAGDYFFATADKNSLIAIVIEPYSQLWARLQQDFLLLLPLAILMATAMISLVIWLSRRRLSPLGQLKIAVDNDEFIVHYQPIVDLKTQTCMGAEALIRWRRPDGSIVSPDFFIPIAEESGVIFALTDKVINTVMSEVKDLLLSNRKLHVAINIPGNDIKTGRFLPVLQAAMKDTGIENQQIWLEITERSFVDVEAARTTLIQARNLGHQVAIDDFGTGYSSLSYLQGLPIDVLKIDKSFVDTIATEAVTSIVTPHIISLAKTLGIKIIAEGLETQAQLDYLRQHEVEYGQGWYFSKALSVEDFILYCEKHS